MAYVNGDYRKVGNNIAAVVQSAGEMAWVIVLENDIEKGLAAQQGLEPKKIAFTDLWCIHKDHFLTRRDARLFMETIFPGT